MDRVPNNQIDAQQTQVTQLLDDIRAGNDQARGHLLELVYKELRSLAGQIFDSQQPGHTLQPTALLHEAWLKLVGHVEGMTSKRHFFCVAAKAMRQVLTDHARKAKAEKRGGEHVTVCFQSTEIEDKGIAPAFCELDLLDLDEQLTKLASLNQRHAQIVEMRLLGTMSMQEIADELGASKRTVESDWMFARAWLRSQLKVH